MYTYRILPNEDKKLSVQVGRTPLSQRRFSSTVAVWPFDFHFFPQTMHVDWRLDDEQKDLLLLCNCSLILTTIIVQTAASQTQEEEIQQ